MSYQLPENSPMRASGFLYGVATAAFQIEGANRADGRCESIWDRFCATPGRVLNGDDGAIACDHYNRLDEDLDLIQALGSEAYRFSVAWPRIEPAPGQWNEAGFAFYERLINGLIARGIQPFLTLYHWDLPQYLEDRGGWVNRETAYRFAEFAAQISQRFGNKVKAYITLNEPWCSSFLSYRIGEHAPGYKGEQRMAYQAAHHLLLAHGLALPLLRQNAPLASHGIALNFSPAYPASDSTADRAAADFINADNGDWFLHAIMTGEYPPHVAAKNHAWLATEMPGDRDIIARPVDFIGINYYSRCQIRAGADDEPEYLPTGHPQTAIGWEIYPAGLTDLLLRLHHTYERLPPLYITENGAADNTDMIDGEIDDELRYQYIQQHLLAVHEAMQQGVDLRGYLVWSLMDNFEWAFGYSQRFGLVHVDYQTQQRTLKKSAKAWQALLAQLRSPR